MDLVKVSDVYRSTWDLTNTIILYVATEYVKP